MKFFYRIVLACCFVIVGNHVFAQQYKGLPDAPLPNPSSTSATASPGGAGKYTKYIDPGQQVSSLTGKDKVVFAFREQAKPWALATPILAAGWEHLLDTNPHYGTDKAGFGERFGVAVLRQGSQAVFADGLAAAVFHEDPRYYRMGGRRVGLRLLYAASRVAITRNDAGNPTIDYARFVGYAGASALTMTYYPAVSAKWAETWKGYGISLASTALGNALHEFAPDVLHFLGKKGH